jgi:DNA phosphorothioation-associated putative methyltransferase
MAQAHATAMVRSDLSRPMRLALDTGLVVPGSTSVFDYGCGRGDDIRLLRQGGVEAQGWDPTSLPEAPLVSADVVNLGYVVNVIQNPEERVAALLGAWRCCRVALVVSARLTSEINAQAEAIGDGCLTTKGTFQRFYTQAELRAWISGILDAEAIAMAPGVFVAFRDSQVGEAWLASTRRRQVSSPQPGVRDRLYERYQSTLIPLQRFYEERGRLPVPEEVCWESAVQEAFGSVARAWQIVRHATGNEPWDAIKAQRRDELLVHLALARLRRRPNFMKLPAVMRADVRALFGSYKDACREADDLLQDAGNLSAVHSAAREAPVGKRTATDLYLHVNALNSLPPLLQVYEGCARFVAGQVEGANILKLAWDAPKVSYLAYPAFDTDPHPPLVAAAVVRLNELSVELRDYGGRANPPILHRKDAFVPEGYPGREKFARLTRQEEKWGLLSSPRIGTRDGWNDALAAAGKALRGHRLVLDRGR